MCETYITCLDGSLSWGAADPFLFLLSIFPTKLLCYPTLEPLCCVLLSLSQDVKPWQHDPAGQSEPRIQAHHGFVRSMYLLGVLQSPLFAMSWQDTDREEKTERRERTRVTDRFYVLVKTVIVFIYFNGVSTPDF